MALAHLQRNVAQGHRTQAEASRSIDGVKRRRRSDFVFYFDFFVTLYGQSAGASTQLFLRVQLFFSNGNSRLSFRVQTPHRPFHRDYAASCRDASYDGGSKIKDIYLEQWWSIMFSNSKKVGTMAVRVPATRALLFSTPFQHSRL